MGAFFVGAIYSPWLIAQPVCPTDQPLAAKRIAKVIDGDTLRLNDGTRIRLASINTPELRGAAHTPEPYARKAQQALSAQVQQAGGRLYMPLEPMVQDRYGRRVTALYTAQGDDVQALLLGQGLGYFVAFLPDQSDRACLKAQEARARKARLGLWRGYAVKTVQTLNAPGFAVVKGKVQTVRVNAKGAWLNLDHALDVYLAQEVHLALAEDIGRYQGREVEVRGWVLKQTRSAQAANSAPWLLRLSHPMMLD